MQPSSNPEQEYTARAVVPGQRVRLTGEPATVKVPHPGCAGEPEVELVRDGDVIQAIDITCTCGRRIRLTCVYQ